MTEYRLHGPASPIASRALAKAALTILAEFISNKETLYNFDLSLSEACANVVRHAYPDCLNGVLEISMLVEPGKTVSVEVSDWGCGFGALPKPVKNAAPEAEGGRGLFIMSELADVFDLRSENGRHTVYMQKKVDIDQWKT